MMKDSRCRMQDYTPILSPSPLMGEGNENRTKQQMRARIGPASLYYAVTGVQDDYPSLKLRVTNGELQIPPNPPFSKGGI